MMSARFCLTSCGRYVSPMPAQNSSMEMPYFTAR